MLASSGGTSPSSSRASSDLASGDQSSRQAADHCWIVRRHVVDLPEDVHRSRGIAFVQHLLAHGQQRLDLGLRNRALRLDLQLGKQLVEHLLDLSFGPIIGEIRDGLAPVDSVNRRDRLDPELRGEQLLLVDVDLGELDALVGIVRSDLVEDRRQLLARAAPFRPEIEDD